MSRVALSSVLAVLALGAASIAPMLSAARVDAPPADAAPAADPPVAVAAPGVHLAVEADRAAVLADGDRLVKVRLELTGDRVPGDVRRVPTDLVLVLDRSGSMSGDKLLDAKAAAEALIGQLGDEDRLALVSFSSDATVDIPLAAGTVAERRARVDALAAGGGTDMDLGLTRALDLFAAPDPGRARRIALISDGLPDSALPLDDLARRAAVGESPLTTIGVGMDYDETLMQRLADQGTGNFHWVQRGQQLAEVLADELDTARETVATGVQLSLSTASGARIVEAAGYPLTDGTLTLGSVFSGQHRSLWVTVALGPDGDPGLVEPGMFEVRWTGTTGAVASASIDLPPIEITTDRSRFAAAVDAEAWADCTVKEDYNDLRSRVSAAVQRGDLAGAQADIAAYRADKTMMNAMVGSAEVDANLQELGVLAAEVDAQAANPADVRNAWSKSVSSQAYQGRRSGQSKSW